MKTCLIRLAKGIGLLVALLLALLLVILHGHRTGERAIVPARLDRSFRDPRPVTIRGYEGHAMEPFLSRDDRLLFFNDSNAPTVNTNLHWAEAVDGLTFEYRGLVGGVNTKKLDAVASMDDGDRFFFTSTRSYDPVKGPRSSLFTGLFRRGSVSAVRLVSGAIDRQESFWINMDAEVSADGRELFLSSARFRPFLPVPIESNLRLALRRDGGFAIAPEEERILARINTANLEYAPATSRDGLELFFTRCWVPGLLGGRPRLMICRAVRESRTAPFGSPMLIEAIHGAQPSALVEAPTLSADGRRLYYHKKVEGVHRIFRVLRDRK